jgi:thioredoxin reductase
MTSHPDFGEVRDITIIGAGPVGLSTAFWAGMREASSRIIDSLPELGGQLTTLYPEKWIFDVPGHRRVLAKDLVAELREQALGQFDVPVHLETTAHEIAWEDDLVVLRTDRGELRSRTVVVAGGHGAFEPKKLPVSDVDMTPWEGRGATYLVGEKKEFEGKRVVIVGGGDSAFDWALALQPIAKSITVVHRRDKFRAHAGTVGKVQALPVQIIVNAEVSRIIGDSKVTAVEVTARGAEPALLPADTVVAALGFTADLGPLQEWGLELDKRHIKVDSTMATNRPRIFAAGDITEYPGKVRLIATGFGEAATAVNNAAVVIDPAAHLFPGHSSDNG